MLANVHSTASRCHSSGFLLANLYPFVEKFFLSVPLFRVKYFETVRRILYQTESDMLTRHRAVRVVGVVYATEFERRHFRNIVANISRFYSFRNGENR